MRPLRAGIITHGGINPPGEGIRVPFLAGLIERLGRDADLTVFSPGEPFPPPGVRSVNNARHIRTGVPQSAGVARKSLSLVSSVLAEHRRTPFDLFHGIWALPSGTFAVLLGRILGVPSVVSLHGAETASIPSIRYGHLRVQPHRALTLWTCRHADAVTLLSEHQRTALTRSGVTRGDPVVISPAPDPSFFVERATGNGTADVRFLHVANLTEVKDQPTLLDAVSIIARTRPCRLRVIGADYLEGKIQRRARELGIGELTEFFGYLPPHDLPPHYRWADILLHTSLHEAGGVVVAEAAAAGLPVFGTRTGLLADLEGEVTEAVEPGDAGGLAARVLAVLDTPSRLAGMRSAGLSWARSHTLESAATTILKTYERLTHS